MRKLVAFAGAAAVALAGTGLAASPKKPASPKNHVMNVPLPDGSIARVEYAGDVAPKVTIAPPPLADADGAWDGAWAFPSFAGFDRMIDEMNRRTQEMMRRAQDMTRHPANAAPYIASYGDFPAGETSTTVVSVSNGGATCTRTTQMVSQGAGKPPKVTSSVTGKCGDAAAPAKGATTPV